MLFLKLFLISLGFVLIYFISKTYLSIFLLFFIILISLIFIKLIEKIENVHILNFFYKFSVPLSFTILILLNLTGNIKTLTGVYDTIIEGSDYTLMFLALPFYLLSASALISDLAESKMKNEKIRYKKLDIFLYIALPFKLLSGPVETPELLNQFKKIQFNKFLSRSYVGISWIILGLFMKFVIANRLLPIEMISFVNPILSTLCAFFFELKFYFDFAGYSFVAYGFALLFNIKLTLNFNHPFTSKNVVYFWKSWHVSLGKFLQRYFLFRFVRVLKNKRMKILFASFIFCISAMWHGGTFNYLLWGLFHGAAYFLYVDVIKPLRINKFLGYFSMLCLFIFGRFIAIESDFERLLIKIKNLFNPKVYFNFTNNEVDYLNSFMNLEKLSFLVAIIFASAFIFLEFYYVNIKNRKRYHYFRKIFNLTIIFFLFLLFGINNGELLYARI